MFANIKDILIVAGPVLGVLASGIPLLIGFVRKTKKHIKERNWNKVTQISPKLIADAESHINYTGEEKKAYVKSRLAVYSVSNKIPFDEARFDAAIDGLVKLTREVNKRERDKTFEFTPVRQASGRSL